MGKTSIVTDIKPYSTKELCGIYGVTKKTMLGWIKKHSEAIGEKKGRYYTALQVETIFEKLGLPGKINEAA